MWWVVLALAVVTAACYRRSRRRLHQLAREIPSALQEYPIIGQAYIFLGTSEGTEPSVDVSNYQLIDFLTDQMTSLQRLGEVTNRQGGASHIWLGNRLYIILTDAKAIEVVSKTCLEKDQFTMKFFRMIIGGGSLIAPVKIWQRRRKILAPCFKLSNLNQLVKVFNEQSTIMTELMQFELDKGDFSIFKYLTMYTFDTIMEVATGIKMNSQVNRGHWLLTVIEDCWSMISERMLKPWLHPDCVYQRLPVYRQLMEHKNRVYDFVEKVIQNKREELAAVEMNGADIDKNRMITFCETILHSSGGLEKGYTNIELLEEGVQIVGAGNDTSAVGSSFAAVMLSRHPDVQDRVYQELKEVFGDSARAVTSEDLPRLKYLEAVIKETLRLYPPGPILFREVHKDVELPSGATLVDGTSVMINIWGTHRNPQYWGADAGQFRPERFLEGPLPHPAMFIPFSYSVRNCIGYPYAMMSLKTSLANLLRRYRLLPPANMAVADLRAPLAVKFNFVMKAVDNFIVRVEERNKVI